MRHAGEEKQKKRVRLSTQKKKEIRGLKVFYIDCEEKEGRRKERASERREDREGKTHVLRSRYTPSALSSLLCVLKEMIVGKDNTILPLSSLPFSTAKKQKKRGERRESRKGGCFRHSLSVQ